MRWNALLPANPTGRPRGLCVAVLISAAVHGIFALIFWSLPTFRSRFVDDKPLSEIAVFIVPDEPLQVSLAPDSAPPVMVSSNPPALGAHVTQPIEVQPLPIESGTGTSAADVPHVKNAGQPGDAGGGSRATDNAPAFFGVQMPARSVVFLIDRSTSMHFNGGLAAAKQELTDKLQRMPATTRFQVFFYDSQVDFLRSQELDGFLANTEEIRERVLEFVKSIRARGGTDHMKALHQAIALRPEAILLITDAEDLLPNQVRSITDVNGGRTAIHTLQWSPGPAENESLKELARQNRGIYRQLGLYPPHEHN